MSNNLINNCNEDLCSDINTLRLLLGLFKERDIKVAISTIISTFGEFISDISEDIVYMSDSINSTPSKFIPLCNIVRVYADASDITDTLREELISNIETLIKSTCNIDRCCCTDGIADTINGMRQFNSNKNDLLCFNLYTNAELTINSNNCFEIGNIVKANAEIVFAISENKFFIYSTPKINSIYLDVPAS